MALLGTLADFHVGDILALLASTRKTGVLVVEGDGRSGRVWVDDGQIVGGQSEGDHEAAVVVFDLLRLEQGRFSFDDGVAPPAPGEPVTVEEVLTEARAKLVEWREIEAVVPSMTSLVALDAGGAAAGDITIAADQWRTVAAVGAGGTVAEVASRLGAGEFAACRAIRSLVDAGLARITPTAPEPAPGAPSGGASSAGGPTPASAPAPAAPRRASDSETSSRSDLVRQLSELRGG